MLPEPELAKTIATLPLITTGGPWTRAVGYHLLQGPSPGSPPDSPPQPLWPKGAPLTGARFTPKGSFGTIYLATDPVTALIEVAGVFANPHAPLATVRTPPWTVFAVDGVIEGVLDLTEPDIVSALGTTVDELTGSWRLSQELHLVGRSPLPPTHLLGKIAWENGDVNGIRYHSAKNAGAGLGLAIFADRLAPGKASFLEVYDPHELIEQRLP